MQTTSDRIAQRMKELGLQHKDLVVATGASKGTVTNWISGVNTPTNERLIKLAQALKTTSSWLLTGNSSPEFAQVEPWDSNTPLDNDEVEIPFFKDFSFACGGGSISEAIANETRKLRMSKATLRNLSITKENAVKQRMQKASGHIPTMSALLYYCRQHPVYKSSLSKVNGLIFLYLKIRW